MKTSLGSILEMWFVLSEAFFLCQIKARTSLREFGRPSGYLKVSGNFCLPLARRNYYDCGPLYAFRHSVLGSLFGTMLQSQTTRLANLGEASKFVSLSCLLLPLYHSFTQMESTRLVVLHAWENCQLSSS